MAIFIVISKPANAQLAATIARVYPGNFYTMASDQWAISAEKLTNEVSDSLNISDGAQGKAAVFKIETYFGWHDKALWEWLDLKSKK